MVIEPAGIFMIGGLMAFLLTISIYISLFPVEGKSLWERTGPIAICSG